MIRLEKVTKRFRVGRNVKTVCRDVSLDVPAGVSLGILGRNGAGKSTLLRMMSGTAAPSSGRIVREGRISWPLGFSGSFHQALTGAQNVRFVARIYGADEEELIEYVQDFAELGESLYAPVRTYSSGMRARLAFGVSMGIRFDVYLVDEITAVGDANFRKKCQQVFREKLASSDVYMVSHSDSTIREYCNAAAVLEDGSLFYYSDVDEALERHAANMAAR